MKISGMKKVVRLGTRMIHDGNRSVSIYCSITVETKDDEKARLSITGVEGPLRNGDAIGSSGQIDMHLGDGADITPAPGWTSESITKFLAIWNAWHLNDMRAGCAHQRAEWDPSKKITLVTWRLTDDALRQQNAVRKEVDATVCAFGSVGKLAPWTHTLYKAAWEITLPRTSEGEPAPWERPEHPELYREHKREEKRSGWVKPEEHPDGILCKPCATCGYKYGSAWLYEPVPDDVLAWLADLPTTDVTPAWV